jgi:hypothetical protein
LFFFSVQKEKKQERNKSDSTVNWRISNEELTI